ncbi:hypothetical protein AK812_SmicGene16252 [Symbiodinium microadriaticum]|uniref:Uncharacterized protein n=1 Tax=Symbiodinium microadriaticum TaxID=2951 RepID=A0A1Q9E0T4_SYMMI|nr:hypothetical protein AK812_SmicGene16252 [Symbiodinium microadriaticum]CAE7248421.1 unnamed protein product [Symbiodinium microadriaticum]CAE7843450.1 unnamed protein product [Symbiodinium sp. KB8]
MQRVNISIGQVTFSAVLDRELILLRVADLVSAGGSIAPEYFITGFGPPALGGEATVPELSQAANRTHKALMAMLLMDNAVADAQRARKRDERLARASRAQLLAGPLSRAVP